MIHEHYMVLELPKEETGGNSFNNSEVAQFGEFDDAFDHFNKLAAKEGAQMFRQPRSPRPLRIALSNSDIELWCIKRTNELLTN